MALRWELEAVPRHPCSLDRLRSLLMLSKRAVLKLIIALVRMNDAQVLSGDAGLTPEVCLPEDRDTVRDVRALLIPLRRGFDYTQSPEFLDGVSGKPANVRAMHEKLANDPVKRQGYQKRFDQALETLPDSDEVFSLVPRADHPIIREVA